MGIGPKLALDAVDVADATDVESRTRTPTGDALLGGGGIAPVLAAFGRTEATGKGASLEAALTLGDLNAFGGAASDV